MKQGVPSFLQNICWGVGTVFSTPQGKRLHLRYFKKDAFFAAFAALVCFAGSVFSLRSFKKAAASFLFERLKKFWSGR